ncbi:phage portal protein [Bifidobacterium scardovii]|uniref:PE-PGRS family protein n=1 Tax=Bifidobacterium scardovii TaxID=158787 RepID=A0A087DI39_9BIFI|nr:phage portal protein [Bifidobacterium scardovii]KFI95189.1 PE-PGRS family protein [Bifidobacterium scardovii]MDK6348731.1 phage portal protein [Bifidobacterium scardovii]MDU8981292.1 phage portal protein [Bifidobacterium scardovii]BAQ31577.1 putative phage portal protein [Bifidobacterium scardovii JCM 12489 = DSM 13734]
MSILFRRKSAVRDFGPPATVTGKWYVADPGTPLTSETDPWRILSSQPSVRKVTSFIARNVARVPMVAYRHTSQGREKLGPGDELSDLVNDPAGTGPGISRYRFVYDLMMDLLLYDRFASPYMPGRENRFIRWPAIRWQFHTVDGAYNAIDGVTNGNGETIPIETCFWDCGYGSSQGISPILTLRQTLDEYTESVKWRREIWKHGLRMPGYWSQALGEAALTPEARRLLQQELADWLDGGGKEGESPVLRGIEYKDMTGFSPKDAQEVEGRTLSDIEVASAYQVPPEMVGARQGNYASTQAFRDALYRETLGSWFEQLQSAFNKQICDRYFPDCFVEFNLEAALRGSFMEDAVVTSQAVGGPWLSVNEARTDHGRQPLGPEYDEILTQLNTVRGGGDAASPHDTGSQNIGGVNNEQTR